MLGGESTALRRYRSASAILIFNTFMSAQHHSAHEIEAQRRMLEEFLGTAKPRFPQGKIAPDDQGEISFAVALDPNKEAVILRFAKPVDWIGLDSDSAIHLAKLLNERAIELAALKISRA